MFVCKMNTTNTEDAIISSVANAVKTGDVIIYQTTSLAGGAQYSVNTNYGEFLCEFMYDPNSNNSPPTILYAKVYTIQN